MTWTKLSSLLLALALAPAAALLAHAAYRDCGRRVSWALALAFGLALALACLLAA
jgi:hypothetical protein